MENLHEIIELVNKSDVKQLLQKKNHKLKQQLSNAKTYAKKNAEKENVFPNPRKKDSKFLLLKVINNNRLRFIRNSRFQKNRREIYFFFSHRANVEKLFEHQISKNHYTYLHFRPYTHSSAVLLGDTTDRGVYFKTV